MAKVIIEFATVENAGNGYFTVTEDRTRQDGSKYKQYYKIWSREEVSKGEVMHVEGLLDAKPSVDFQTGQERKWTDRNGKEHTSVEINVNNPTINKLGKTPTREATPF